MVLDFLEVAAWWRREVEPLVDHRFLNETMPEKFLPTTAENIAAWVLTLLAAADLPVTEVTVWETLSASRLFQIGCNSHDRYNLATYHRYGWEVATMLADIDHYGPYAPGNGISRRDWRHSH
jgi:6-pyruvoyl-tetrahydropterin synthase